MRSAAGSRGRRIVSYRLCALDAPGRPIPAEGVGERLGFEEMTDGEDVSSRASSPLTRPVNPLSVTGHT